MRLPYLTTIALEEPIHFTDSSPWVLTQKSKRPYWRSHGVLNMMRQIFVYRSRKTNNLTLYVYSVYVCNLALLCPTLYIRTCSVFHHQSPNFFLSRISLCFSVVWKSGPFIVFVDRLIHVKASNSKSIGNDEEAPGSYTSLTKVGQALTLPRTCDTWPNMGR